MDTHRIFYMMLALALFTAYSVEGSEKYSVFTDSFNTRDGKHGLPGFLEDGEDGEDGKTGTNGKNGGHGGNGGSSTYGNGGHGGHGGDAV